MCPPPSFKSRQCTEINCLSSREFLFPPFSFLQSLARSLPLREENPYSIAVMKLKGMGISEIETETLTEALYSSVSQILLDPQARLKEKYTLLERSQMEKILDQFQMQDVLCTDDSCAVVLGKILSVQQIVVGSIGLVGDTYSVSCRIVDVESSKIIRASTRRCNGKIDGVMDILPHIINELLPSAPIPMVKSKIMMKSFVLPGSGQRYADHTVRGNIISVLQAVTLAGVVGATIMAMNAQNTYDSSYDAYSKAPTLEKIALARTDMKNNYDKCVTDRNRQYTFIGLASRRLLLQYH